MRGARTVHHLGRRGLSWLLALVSLAALSAPVGVWWRLHDQPDVVRQAQPPSVALPPGTLASFTAHARQTPAAAAPLILSWHDIRPTTPPGDRYSVTPTELKAQLQMLRAAGFRSMSGAELANWIDGGAAPPRSVVLTFDDNAAGLWKWADPILAETGFTAVVFVISERMNERPYYLSWDELHRMVASGRWYAGSHTADSHGRVPVGPDGPRQPKLINRAWLAASERLETIDEFARRVTADLDLSVTALTERGFPEPRLFAFPFSAEQTPTNDPAAPAVVDTLVAARFAASLTNVSPPQYPTEEARAARKLPRLEVFSGTSAAELFRQVRAAEQRLAGPTGRS